MSYDKSKDLNRRSGREWRNHHRLQDALKKSPAAQPTDAGCVKDTPDAGGSAHGHPRPGSGPAGRADHEVVMVGGVMIPILGTVGGSKEESERTARNIEAFFNSPAQSGSLGAGAGPTGAGGATHPRSPADEAVDELAQIEGSNDQGWLRRVACDPDAPMGKRRAAERRLKQLRRVNKESRKA